MKKTILALSLLLSSWAALPLAAGVMTYQGRLKETNIPVSAVRYFSFDFCDQLTGGVCLQTPSGPQPFAVQNGLFISTFAVPAADLSTGVWYLQVSVGLTAPGVQALAPRERLTAVPYAVYSTSAAYVSSALLKAGDTMTGPFTLSGASMTIVSGGAVRFAVDTSGKAGINTSPDVAGLTISGNSTYDSGIMMQNGASQWALTNHGGVLKVIKYDPVTFEALRILNTGDVEIPAGGLKISGAQGISAAAAVFAPNVVISSEAGAALGSGVRVSTNIYVVGFSSAAKYYGDGSGLTGVVAGSAVSKGGDTMTGALTMAGSSVTINANSGQSYALLTNGVAISTGGALQTTGTGNGTVTGNARGNGAVDLQTYRVSNLQVAKGNYSVISGGQRNTADMDNNTVAGGYGNSAAGSYAVISGGLANQTGGSYGVVSGGSNNSATGLFYPVVSGGYLNTANGDSSNVAGGRSNSAGGSYAVVPGGQNNAATGQYSLAAGYASTSAANGTFTWADSLGVSVVNNTPDRTLFKNRGGFLVTGSTSTNLTGALDRGVLFTGDGLVGISTGAPQAALDVVSSGTAAAQFAQLWRDSNGVIRSSMSATGVLMAAKFIGDGSGLTGASASAVTAAADALVTAIGGAVKLQAGGADRLVVLNGGNVGIGEAAPGALLTVKTPNTAATVVEALRLVNPASGDNAGVGLTFVNNTTNKEQAGIAGFYDVSTNTKNTLAFYTGNAHTEQMRISDLGWVAVGTTTPTSRFDVVNGSITTRGTSAGVVIGDSARTILPEPSAVNGSGLRISTNTYTVGFSSAAKYYGDGSALTGVTVNLGIVGVANGGTGLAAGTAGGLPYYSAAATMASMGAGTTGDILQSNGAAAPSWATPASANVSNTLVKRDGSGNFAAGSITAATLTTSAGAVISDGTGAGFQVTSLQSGYFGLSVTKNASYEGGSNGIIESIGFNHSAANTQVVSGLKMTLNDGTSNGAGWDGIYLNTTGAGTGTGAKTLLNLNDQNVNRFVVLKNGNVGIGTSTPAAREDIVSAGSTNADMAAIWRNSGGVIVGSMSATGQLEAVRLAGDGSGLLNVPVGANVASSLTVASSVTVAGNAFSVGGSTFTVKAGNVAIGTTTTSAVLTLNDNIGLAPAYPTVILGIPSGSAAYVAGNSATNRVAFGWNTLGYAEVDSLGGKLVLNYNSGQNVGVGTISPASKFTVNNGDIRISTTGGNFGLYFQDGSYQTTAAVPQWGVSGSDIYSSTTSGNVGIGTMNPANSLHVKSRVSGDGAAIDLQQDVDSNYTGLYFKVAAVDDGTRKKGAIFFDRVGAYGRGNLRFATNDVQDNVNVTIADTRMIVTNTGKVGVGVPSPAYTLDISTVNAADSYLFRAGINGIVISTGGAIQTTGAGYGTAVGSARGIGAVDLQTQRYVSTQVASADYSAIGGGSDNAATDLFAVVGGGAGNRATKNAATVGGGNGNLASDTFATVAGGINNTASGVDSAVGGGIGNIASGNYAAVSGGQTNSAGGVNAAVSGGTNNQAAALGTAIGGGQSNTANAQYATVAGGSNNKASAQYAAVPGGSYNEAGGENSFAAGIYAKSQAANSFTWQDSGSVPLINSVYDRTVFKNKSGFLVTGSTNTNISGTADRGVFMTGNGMVGISIGAPEAALDVVSTGTTVSEYAQIWRKSDGTIVASMTATGVLYATVTVAGDGMGNNTASGLLTANYGVTSSTAINAGYYQINGSTMLAALSGTGSFSLGGGAGNLNSGNNNSFLGNGAGYNNISGADNTFVGAKTGYTNNSGASNAFVGFESGYYNGIGSDNTFLGFEAGLTNGAGSQNVAIGKLAAGGVPVASFSSSTIVGYKAGFNVGNGSFANTFLGWQAGYNVTSGTGNIVIGNNQYTSSPGASNELNIGGAIYGNLANGNIGIGGTAAAAKLQVNGDVGLGDGTAAGNKPLTIWLTNGGAAVAAGAIVAATGNNSFATAAAASYTAVIGVAYEAIGAGAVGRIAIAGVVPVQTFGAVNAGEHVINSATAGKADSTPTPTSGASIGVWLETLAGGGTAKALLR